MMLGGPSIRVQRLLKQQTEKKGEFKSKCKSLFKSYFVTKWLPNEEDVHRYFVWFEKKYKYKVCTYVCINTDVVTWWSFSRKLKEEGAAGEAMLLYY